MKKFLNWQLFFGTTLIALSAIVYLIHFAIFRDAHHIFIYMIGDIAFVFFEVLLVTLILHQLLDYREKKVLLNKLYMVIGAFFSDVGTELLKILSVSNLDINSINKKLTNINEWPSKEFLKKRKDFNKQSFNIDIKKVDLQDLKAFLSNRRQFLLGLLENQNLLEHESFTNLLWATFHLTEELIHRKSLSNLPKSDYEHLSGDLKRAYGYLISEWLDYMKHLKDNYPYLFSLAVRTNPFNPDIEIEVK
ncbi:hypothetical protein ACFL0P_00785 [Candidatus Omnitrophota bacterium]